MGIALFIAQSVDPSRLVLPPHDICIHSHTSLKHVSQVTESHLDQEPVLNPQKFLLDSYSSRAAGHLTFGISDGLPLHKPSIYGQEG